MPWPATSNDLGLLVRALGNVPNLEAFAVRPSEIRFVVNGQSGLAGGHRWSGVIPNGPTTRSERRLPISTGEKPVPGTW
jgi:hypothetical protein